MAGDRYLGMVFVYPRNLRKLYWAKSKIIEILAKKYETVSGYYTSRVGGIYINEDRIMGWKYTREVEYDDLPYFLKEGSYEIVWEERMDGGIEDIKHEHWIRLAKRIEKVAFKAFPPRRYLDKWGVEYDKNWPAFPLGQKEGPYVDIDTPFTRYNYTGKKYFIALDFGTYENYFLLADEKLSRAVEEFLVDLMRDVARETKPEYAYMNINEWSPLEEDLVCDNGLFKVRYHVYEHGEIDVDCYLPPLMYLSSSVIDKNGGSEFLEYMGKKKRERLVWDICEMENGVLFHIGDLTLPANRPQRSFLNIVEYVISPEKREEIVEKIRNSGKKKGHICDYESGL